MPPRRRSTSPDKLRRFMKRTEQQLAGLSRPAPPSSTASAAAMQDSQPRWVAFPIDFTAFTGTAATTVQATLVTGLPAGVTWTAVWIEPMTLFVSPAPSTWRLGVLVPATGATTGGTPKTVDVTAPDALAQQGASWYVQTDRSAPVDVAVEIDSGGGDTADLLSAGSAVIHLLLSVPGSAADDLPHE